MFTKGAKMKQNKELTHKDLIEKLENLGNENEIFNYYYIGESILSRKIPIITLGDKDAKKSVLYVATHHATENICTSVLLSFIKEYLEAYKSMRQICQINLRYLFKMRKIHIVPMLNPDGVEYRLNGIDDANPIKQRVVGYNCGSSDFSKWNANARGVDLNHNYNAYFDTYKEYEKENKITAGASKFSGESAESEPEIQALTSFIRYYSDELQGILTLHSQGEEIYYKSNGICPKGTEVKARHIAKMTGYALSEAKGSSACGGLTDWCIKELNIPSFTIECGKGENPLDITQAGSIYLRLRELLFTFPILF